MLDKLMEFFTPQKSQKEQLIEEIETNVLNIINQKAEEIRLQQIDWCTESFAPKVQEWILEELLPKVQEWILEELLPEVNQYISDYYSLQSKYRGKGIESLQTRIKKKLGENNG